MPDAIGSAGDGGRPRSEVHVDVLAITEDAAAAIKGIVGAPDLPEGAGLRITQELRAEAEGEAPRTDLRLSVVAAPEEGDEVLADERVFVAAEASEFLDDKLLDADIVDDEVRFSLDVQAERL
jgi:iron-sulfur cluster assembly protein